MSLEFLRCGRALNLASGAPNLKSALWGKSLRYAPDRDFDTLHVALDLSVDFAKRSIDAECRTVIRAFRTGVRSLRFDAERLKISAVSVDGKPVRFKARKGSLVVYPSRPLSLDQQAEVRVRYRIIDPPAGLHFVYPDARNPRNPVQLWSQSQPEDARFWFPCHDAPHQKATSEVRLSVPRGFVAVSNGALVEERQAGSRWIFHWRMSRPHAIYLISLAVGRFSKVETEWDGIPILYYCERGREAAARRGLGKTPEMMAFFSEITGVRYPYEKYAQTAVAEYPGGMENTTATTQTDAVLIDERAALDNDLDALVAHELAHQWFGDLVTCRDWPHAWLNEGFATYFEILFMERDRGKDHSDWELRANALAYFDEEAKRYHRPIVYGRYAHAWTLFDRHTYEKASWVLHMLRNELGEETWRSAIRHYLLKHRDRSVETSDLKLALEEMTGRNFKPFFDQWLYRAGHPSLRVEYRWREGRAKVRVLQTQDVSDESPAYRFPVTLRFTGRGWTREFRENVGEKESRFSYRLPSEPLDFEFDPEHRVLKKLALTKPQPMWRRQLLSARSAISRLEAAAQVAGWGDAASVRLLAAAVRRERFWGAAAEMTRSLGSVGTEEAFAALRPLLRLPHPKVRRAVVDALAGFRRKELKEVLRPALRDRSLNVQASACRALGALRDPRALAPVRPLLKSQSYRDIVSSGAVGALGASRDPKAVAELLRHARPPHGYVHRANAIRALQAYAPISSAIVPQLCALVEDPRERDERLHLIVIEALGALRDERALPALRKIEKGANVRARVYAIEAIARVTEGSAGPK